MQHNNLIDQKKLISNYFTIINNNAHIDGFRNIFIKPDNRTFTFHINELNKMVDKICELTNQYDVYYEVCLQKESPLPGRRGSEKGVIAVPGFWLDIDIKGGHHIEDNLFPDLKTSLSFLKESIALTPTLIIFTGGGIHVYWLFKEPYLISKEHDRHLISSLSDQFQTSVINIARQNGYHIDKTSDLARLLRIPGTYNRKGDPVLVTILTYEDNRYSITDFNFIPLPSAPTEAIQNIPPGLIQQGTRNNTLTAIAGKLVQLGLSKDKITNLLSETNTTHCTPPLPDTEILQIVKNIQQYQTDTKSFTDLGNAERLVNKYGEDIRYSHQVKSWYIWDTMRFSLDVTSRITELAKETVKEIFIESAKYSQLNPRHADALKKHAMKSSMHQRINAMITLAQSDPKVAIDIDKLDTSPWFLNCQNGTLDLRTGELHPHRREHLITKLIPIEYDADAQCPQFLEFLYTIMGRNTDLVSYLKRIFGYALTGTTIEQCIFIFFGIGGNGKTTLLEIIRKVLADYAKNAEFDSFIYRLNSTIRNDLARLCGSRFVTASEPERNVTLSESLVKQITGGEPITVRLLHKEYFEFFPTFKVFFAVNKKPNIIGADTGIWRRIRLIPFNVTISENQRDKNLLEKLQKELPGILSWAVEGCMEWQREGLQEPKEVLEETNYYKYIMDDFADYIADQCIVGPTEYVGTKELFQNYTNWSNYKKLKSIGKKEFNEKIKERGYTQKRDSKTQGWKWSGIGLKKNLVQETLTDSPKVDEHERTCNE